MSEDRAFVPEAAELPGLYVCQICLPLIEKSPTINRQMMMSTELRLPCIPVAGDRLVILNKRHSIYIKQRLLIPGEAVPVLMCDPKVLYTGQTFGVENQLREDGWQVCDADLFDT
jgi:hypothetical protein